jgi:hypothetical protein
MTDLATISFSETPTISFKKVLPPLLHYGLIKGVFLTEEMFFVSINCNSFYQDQTLFQTFNPSHV